MATFNSISPYSSGECSNPFKEIDLPEASSSPECLVLSHSYQNCDLFYPLNCWKFAAILNQTIFSIPGKNYFTTEGSKESSLDLTLRQFIVRTKVPWTGLSSDEILSKLCKTRKERNAEAVGRGAEGHIRTFTRVPEFCLKRFKQKCLVNTPWRIHSSVSLLMYLSERLETDFRHLKKHLAISRVACAGKDFIVKQFFPESKEVGEMVMDLGYQTCLKNLKNELEKGDSQDAFVKILLKRLDGSANLHYSPTLQKIILIDAL